MADNEFRQYTRWELLVNIRNEYLDKLIRVTIDAGYLDLKFSELPLGPKGTPTKKKKIGEKRNMLNRAAAEISKRLDVIDKLIEEEKVGKYTVDGRPLEPKQ